ncbi:MAG: MotA/TolQ/ExbB proton channel family protein [Planctomycetota bacterium]|nr:MotA/TolQ/ExbB proton channel family protein [Planctomycetota bacterium]
MDLATVIGICAGFGLIGWAIVMGGSTEIFVDVPAILIVIGGMIASAFIHFSLGQVLRIMTVLKKTIFNRLPNHSALIQQMVNYAAINRRDGALALEQHIRDIKDAFLTKGLQMLVDGQKEEAIEKQLSLEIQYLQERHADGKKMFEFMGAAAPAFGMVGTLIGLIQMLRTLDDPSKIGAGMATSLVCTFYGAAVANVILLPLAGKLGIQSKRETMVREMAVEGLLAIARGEGPTAVREKMQAFVSAAHREDLKPKV